MTLRTRPVRAVGGLGVAWGAVLLVRGRDVWRAVTAEPATAVDLVTVRALGGRHLVQGAAQVVAPTRMRRAILAVDLVHVLTMLPVVVLDDRRRRAAALTGALSLASAATTLATAGTDGAGGR